MASRYSGMQSCSSSLDYQLVTQRERMKQQDGLRSIGMERIGCSATLATARLAVTMARRSIMIQELSFWLLQGKYSMIRSAYFMALLARFFGSGSLPSDPGLQKRRWLDPVVV
jgi:hypothetical protein